MKFLFYKVSSNKSDKRKSLRISIERFLFLVFIVTFTMLVLIQTALTNPSVRTFLNASNEFEGTPLGVEEFLYDEGNIVLGLVDYENNPELKVLINGEEVAAFNERTVEVSVKNGDVLEVDGSSSAIETEIEIVAKSDNISSERTGKRIRVQSAVSRIAKIKLE